jgi:hypothetical protein
MVPKIIGTKPLLRGRWYGEIPVNDYKTIIGSEYLEDPAVSILNQEGRNRLKNPQKNRLLIFENN